MLSRIVDLIIEMKKDLNMKMMHQKYQINVMVFIAFFSGFCSKVNAAGPMRAAFSYEAAEAAEEAAKAEAAAEAVAKRKAEKKAAQQRQPNKFNVRDAVRSHDFARLSQIVSAGGLHWLETTLPNARTSEVHFFKQLWDTEETIPMMAARHDWHVMVQSVLWQLDSNYLFGRNPNSRAAILMAQKNSRGRTAIHLAAIHGSLRYLNAVATTIYDWGVTTTSTWKTALHFAAAAGHAQVVEFLLNKGAQPLVHDKAGETPETLARKAGHTKIADRLSNWEAPQSTCTGL